MSSDRVELTEESSGSERETKGQADSQAPRTRVVEPVWVWGVPFAPFSMSEAVRAIEQLIDEGQPSFFITANVHYAMLTDEHPDVREINQRASFILADGAPLVWASRWLGSPLPERVAGSDLIFELSAVAARRGYRVFLLGVPRGLPRKRRRDSAIDIPVSRSSALSTLRFASQRWRKKRH